MRAFAGVASCVLLGLASAIFGLPKVNLIAAAQPIPKSLEEGGAENALRARKNQWTVGVAGGQLSGTYMIFADELAQVLNDGDNLRILPTVTYGAVSNLEDLLYLQGVDVAVTQADVFEHFRTQRKPPISKTESTTFFACQSPNCTCWRETKCTASRTCAA